MTSTDLDAVEARAAAEGGAVKRAYVRRIFSEIAPRYDLLNHLLSFNVDKRWRAKAIRELGWTRVPDGTYLDLCAGTLDVGTQLLKDAGFRGFVLGTDFALPMLQAGVGKAPRERLSPVNGDALELPYRDNALDGAIVAFGIRIEGEGFDLADLSLPWGQDAVIDAVASANPNTIVVLETGNPVSMPWRGKVKAIVQAWYSGQAGGQATFTQLATEIVTSPQFRFRRGEQPAVVAKDTNR